MSGMRGPLAFHLPIAIQMLLPKQHFHRCSIGALPKHLRCNLKSFVAILYTGIRSVNLTWGWGIESKQKKHKEKNKMKDF